MSSLTNFNFEAGEKPPKRKIIIPPLKRTRKIVEELKGIQDEINYIGDETNPKIRKVQIHLDKLISQQGEIYDRNEEEIKNVTKEFNEFKTKTQEDIILLNETINELQNKLMEANTVIEQVKSILEEGERANEITVIQHPMTTLQQKCEKADHDCDYEIEDQADIKESKNIIETEEDVFGKLVMLAYFSETEEQSIKEQEISTTNCLNFEKANIDDKNVFETNETYDSLTLCEREEENKKIDNIFMGDDKNEAYEQNRNDDSNEVEKDDKEDCIVMVLEVDSIRPLPFTGDGSVAISEFLAEFEDFTQTLIVPWDNKRKGLGIRAFLADRAREVYDEIPNKENYEEVKTFLIQKFQTERMKEKALNKLIIMNQEPNESVLEFTNRLTKLVKQVMAGKGRDEYQERLLKEFSNKLSLDYRHLVRGQNPDTFEKALDLAEQYEADFVFKNLKCPKDKTFTMEVQEGNFWERQGQMSVNDNGEQEHVVIRNYCGTPGHTSNACWSNPQSRPTPSSSRQAFEINMRGNNNQSYEDNRGQIYGIHQQWQNSWQSPYYQGNMWPNPPTQMQNLNNEIDWNNAQETDNNFEDEVNIIIEVEGDDNKKDIIFEDSVCTLMAERKKNIMAVTTVEVNNILMTGLIDTGSSITVCPLPLVKILKADIRKVDRQVSGLFGNSGKICGSIIGNIKIGGSKYRTEIFVLNVSKLTQSGNCEIIIGCDTLGRGSEIGIDCATKTMRFGGMQVKMGTFDVALKRAINVNKEIDNIFVTENEKVTSETLSYRKPVDERYMLKQNRKLQKELSQHLVQMKAAGIIQSADSHSIAKCLMVQKIDRVVETIVNNDTNPAFDDKIEIVMSKEESLSNTVGKTETVSEHHHLNKNPGIQNMECTYCGRMGHLSETCWTARRIHSQRPHHSAPKISCAFCGVLGHKIERCWRLQHKNAFEAGFQQGLNHYCKQNHNVKMLVGDRCHGSYNSNVQRRRRRRICYICRQRGHEAKDCKLDEK